MLAGTALQDSHSGRLENSSVTAEPAVMFPAHEHRHVPCPCTVLALKVTVHEPKAGVCDLAGLRAHKPTAAAPGKELPCGNAVMSQCQQGPQPVPPEPWVLVSPPCCASPSSLLAGCADGSCSSSAQAAKQRQSPSHLHSTGPAQCPEGMKGTC